MMSKLFQPLWTAAAVAALALALTQACSTAPKTVDITETLKDSLRSAGLRDVSVSQDREKGVVTLRGTVTTDGEKAQAETIARSIAGSQVVGNEIAVLPVGNESAAKTIHSDIDDGIKKNLDAALIKSGLHDQVSYDAKMGVVTLTGEVTSMARRGEAQQVAAGVPNVTQVVNKLDVKNLKATSSKQ